VTFYTRYVSSLSIPSSKSLSDELTVALLRSQILRGTSTSNSTRVINAEHNPSTLHGFIYIFLFWHTAWISMHTNGPLNSDTDFPSLPFPSLAVAFGRAGQGFRNYIRAWKSTGWAAAGQGKGEAVKVTASQPSRLSTSNNLDQDAPQISTVTL
jgi:hypothetical protein